MSFPAIAKSVLPVTAPKFRYSICTMVTDPAEYRLMVDSFISAGFNPDFCEFLYCDNSSGNQRDGFEACELFLRSAQGEHIILCHQDVLLDFDHIDTLDNAIRDMDARDKNWALLGNAGGISADKIALHITQPGGKSYNTGKFPLKAQSLDENFIVVKAAAHLSLSHDLEGFHLYGTDLCQVAAFRGLSAYVIDFHLFHKGKGDFDESFRRSYQAMSHKYRSTHRDGSIQTMGALLPTGRSPWQVRRALFLQMQKRKKLARDKPEAEEGATRIRKILGSRHYYLQLVYHRIIHPMRQFFETRASKPPR